MENILIYVASGSLFLFGVPACLFILVNENSPWVHGFQAAGALVWAGFSVLVLAVVGMLKIAEIVRERVQ